MIWAEMTKAEKIDKINRLFTENPDWSAREIAEILGAGSRNAVIGFLHRHSDVVTWPGARVSNRERFEARQKREGEKARRRQKRDAEKAMKAKHGKRVTLPRPPASPDFPAARPIRPDVWLPLAGTTPVSMDDLTPRQCKWPIGEHPVLFCGCPAPVGKPYCEAHARMAAGRAPA